LPHVSQQAAARALALIEHLLETLLAAGPGIRNLGAGRRRRVEAAKQRQLWRRALADQPLQVRQVLAVHRDHQIEALEVGPRELPREVIELDAAPPRRRARAPI